MRRWLVLGSALTFASCRGGGSAEPVLNGAMSAAAPLPARSASLRPATVTVVVNTDARPSCWIDAARGRLHARFDVGNDYSPSPAPIRHDWDVRSLQRLPKPEEPPNESDLSPDGKTRITTRALGTARLLNEPAQLRYEFIDVATDKRIASAVLPLPISLSRDREALAQLYPWLPPRYDWTSGSRFVRISRGWHGWDGPTEQSGFFDVRARRLRKDVYDRLHYPTTLSPDDRFIITTTQTGSSATDTVALAVEDVDTGRRIGRMDGAYEIISWSPDLERVAARVEGGAAVFNHPSGARLYDVPGASLVAFCPDGDLAVVRRDDEKWRHEIWLHDGLDGSAKRRIGTPPAVVPSPDAIGVSPDSAFLYHQMTRNAFRVYRVADGAMLTIRVARMPPALHFVAFAHTEDGVIDGEPELGDALTFEIAGVPHPFSDVREQLYRPGMSRAFFEGRPLPSSGLTAKPFDLREEDESFRASKRERSTPIDPAHGW